MVDTQNTGIFVLALFFRSNDVISQEGVWILIRYDVDYLLSSV